MQSFTLKKKQQARNADASSVIHCLDLNVKTLIDILPSEDKEVFAYLITHPSEEANVELVSKEKSFKIKANVPSKSPQGCQFLNSSKVEIRKFGSGQRNGYHQPSFICDCFQCYMSHWSRWNTSPNQALIHKAILLNESVSHSKSEPSLLKLDYVGPGCNNTHSIDFNVKEESLGATSGVAIGLDVRTVTSVCRAPALPADELLASDRAPVVTGDALKHLADKAKSEKTAFLEPVVAEKTLLEHDASEVRQDRKLSKEDNKQKKKTVKKAKVTAKGISGKQQESIENIKKGDLPAKYRTKQVAPLMDLKGETAAETLSFEPEITKLQYGVTDSTAEVPIKVQPSLSHAFSSTLSFVADRLLTLWYPRRPRGIGVF